MRTQEQYLEYQLHYRIENKHKINQQIKDWRLKKKYEVFNHYGLKCLCCGESDFDKLTIDHINGGGKKHRKILGGGDRLYHWLIKNDFPKHFQTLCMNCNKGKFLNSDVCPHIQIKTKNLNRHQRYAIRLREKIFENYGKKCFLCNEDNIIFLSVDHIDESGSKHREEIGNSSKCLYQFLDKNNFPKGFQILCHNCNLKKYRVFRRNGVQK